MTGRFWKVTKPLMVSKSVTSSPWADCICLLIFMI